MAGNATFCHQPDLAVRPTVRRRVEVDAARVDGGCQPENPPRRNPFSARAYFAARRSSHCHAGPAGRDALATTFVCCPAGRPRLPHLAGAGRRAGRDGRRRCGDNRARRRVGSGTARASMASSRADICTANPSAWSREVAEAGPQGTASTVRRPAEQVKAPDLTIDTAASLAANLRVWSPSNGTPARSSRHRSTHRG